jgi:hypothetical protein
MFQLLSPKNCDKKKSVNTGKIVQLLKGILILIKRMEKSDRN